MAAWPVMTSRSDGLLAKIDQAFTQTHVSGSGIPPTKAGRPRKPPFKTDPAASIKMDRAIWHFRNRQAKLILEATALLDQEPGKLSEGDIGQRVHRGLWVAWARYLAATDPKAAWQAATAFGIFFDKWRLIQGLPTAITEERRVERLELLAKIQAVLTTRGESKAATVMAIPPAAASGDPRTPGERMIGSPDAQTAADRDAP